MTHHRMPGESGGHLVQRLHQIFSDGMQIWLASAPQRVLYTIIDAKFNIHNTAMIAVECIESGKIMSLEDVDLDDIRILSASASASGLAVEDVPLGGQDAPEEPAEVVGLEGFNAKAAFPEIADVVPVASTIVEYQ